MIPSIFCRGIAVLRSSMGAFFGGEERQTRVIDGSASISRSSVMRSSGSYSRKAESGSALEVQRSTVRGQDKRPQGASRSVVCFDLGYWRISQCWGSERNVRWLVKPLLNMTFPHVAGAGNG